MPKVVHFEVHTSDPQRAMKFYAGLFGWKFEKYEGSPMDYWMITAGEKNEAGANGGLLKRMGGAPSDGAAVNAYVCTIGVDSLDETVTKATGLGGTIALPKMPIPGMGWLAYLKDTEGNIFGVMQPETGAK
jgi:predicted enzyme related to lactoylglutathione lyase